MIWNSVFMMTASDLLILAGAAACFGAFWRSYRSATVATRRKARTGTLLLLIGVFLISAFYMADLVTMHVFPWFVAKMRAMAIMRELHLNFIWIFTVTGFGFIAAGFVVLNRDIFSLLVRLESSESAIRNELSERLKEQAALDHSRTSLANAQRIARIGNWERDLKTGALWWSDEVYRIFGRKPAAFEPTFRSFKETIHPDDRAQVGDAVVEAVRSGTPYSIDHRIILPDGTQKVVHEQGEVVCDDAGLPARFSGTVQDITERKRAEDAVREAELRFRDFAEASSDWFWEMDADLRFAWVSDRLVEASGFPHSYYIGKTPHELGAPVGERDNWRHYLESLEAHEPVRGVYFKRHSKDGVVRQIRVSAKPIFSPDGSFLGYRGTGRAFADEAAAVEQAVRVRDQFLNAIELISEGIALFDEDERLIICNSQFRKSAVHGDDPAMIGARFEDIVRTNVRAGWVAVPEEMAEEWIAWRMERFRNPGDPFEIVIRDRHLLVREQRLPQGGTIYLNSDITEIRQREEELRQAQKMEIVGQLTGGVAHDFNNLLAVISGNLELLAERLAERNDALSAFVQKCLDAADRGAELTQRLLAFSRKQPLLPQIVDVAELMRQLPSLLHRTLGAGISVRVSVPDGLWPVFADPGQIENALLNLALNARDAMPDGGRLTFEAANRTVGDGDLRQFGDMEPGDYVMIAVRDTGDGMPAEIIEKVIEPFFTTKPVGKGSGLGLSMVYGFCKQSGGDVAIESEVGHGTSIRMLLPRSESRRRPAGSETRDDVVAGNGEAVLVVEDDPAVLELASGLLDSLNYRVLSASDGPTALALIEGGDDIDLLFTDIVLPRTMDGVELARQARSRRPDLRVLYTSGYTDKAADIRADETDRTELLTKPYHKAALARSIRRTLAGRSA